MSDADYDSQKLRDISKRRLATTKVMGRMRKQELSPVVKGCNEGLIHGFALAASLVEQRTNGLFTLIEPDEIKEARARKARSR